MIFKKTNKNKIIGYSSGVFDLFHIGHLNILESAKKNCDFHIVAVTTDDLVKKIKGFNPIIPFEERKKIIAALSCVDLAVDEFDIDKISAWNKYKFDIIFKGDDWKGTNKWNKLEKEFDKLNVQVKYFKYTQNTSSTKLRSVIDKFNHGKL